MKIALSLVSTLIDVCAQVSQFSRIDPKKQTNSCISLHWFWPSESESSFIEWENTATDKESKIVIYEWFAQDKMKKSQQPIRRRLYYHYISISLCIL